MVKKFMIAGLVVLGAVFLLKFVGMLPYCKMWVKKAREEVKASVPLETKIELLRQEIADLEKDAPKNRSLIAGEIVAIDRLKQQITEARANLAKKEKVIADLRADLKSGTAFVSLDGEKLPRQKVEDSLIRQWNAYKRAEEAVKAKEQLLRARQESLEINKQKLDTMESKRKEMQAKVETLQVELDRLRLAQTKSNVAVDDSEFSRVQRLFEDVENQIATEKKKLELENAAFTDTVVEKAVEHRAQTSNALKEMDEHFGAQNRTGQKVASEK